MRRLNFHWECGLQKRTAAAHLIDNLPVLLITCQSAAASLHWPPNPSMSPTRQTLAIRRCSAAIKSEMMTWWSVTSLGSSWSNGASSVHTVTDCSCQYATVFTVDPKYTSDINYSNDRKLQSDGRPYGPRAMRTFIVSRLLANRQSSSNFGDK